MREGMANTGVTERPPDDSINDRYCPDVMNVAGEVEAWGEKYARYPDAGNNPGHSIDIDDDAGVHVFMISRDREVDSSDCEELEAEQISRHLCASAALERRVRRVKRSVGGGPSRAGIDRVKLRTDGGGEVTRCGIGSAGRCGGMQHRAVGDAVMGAPRQQCVRRHHR